MTIVSATYKKSSLAVGAVAGVVHANTGPQSTVTTKLLDFMSAIHCVLLENICMKTEEWRSRFQEFSAFPEQR